MLAVMSVLYYGAYYAVARGSSITTSKNLSTNLLNQAAYSVITNSSDVDGDGIPESPAMITASPAPVGGGQLPANIGAPLSDAWGTPLGYCAWDNGTINSSAGRINGDNPGTQSSVVFAVISAGPDKTFETSCAQARAGNAQGDDGIRYVTVAQINQGVGGTVYYGDPVANMAALNALNTATIKVGQTRLVASLNQYYQWTGGTWQQTSNPYWVSDGTNAWNTNTGNVGIGTTAPAAKLSVNGDLQIPITEVQCAYGVNPGNNTCYCPAGYFALSCGTNHYSPMTLFVSGAGCYSEQGGGYSDVNSWVTIHCARIHN